MMRTDINPLELNDPFYALTCDGKVIFTHPRLNVVAREARRLHLGCDAGDDAGNLFPCGTILFKGVKVELLADAEGRLT